MVFYSQLQLTPPDRKLTFYQISCHSRLQRGHLSNDSIVGVAAKHGVSPRQDIFEIFQSIILPAPTCQNVEDYQQCSTSRPVCYMLQTCKSSINEDKVNFDFWCDEWGDRPPKADSVNANTSVNQVTLYILHDLYPILLDAPHINTTQSNLTSTKASIVPYNKIDTLLDVVIKELWLAVQVFVGACVWIAKNYSRYGGV